MLQEHKNSAFTLNINANLIEMLIEYNLFETIDIIKDLRSEGKIEINGTAKFHPILPLIPKEEAKRQILLNEETHIKIFDNWKPKGFFPPELSIDSNIIKLVHELGYEWVLSSGIGCPQHWPYNKIYRSPEGLRLYFRDDILSNKISFNNITAKQFISDMREMFNNINNNNENKYIITAMDSETFGHHHKNYERTFLSKTLELINDEDEIKLVFISNLNKIFPEINNPIYPLASSWSTTEEDIEYKIPYPLWDNPNNNIHQLYWKMMRATEQLINLASEFSHSQKTIVKNHIDTARWFYDQCLCSDTTWWANPNKGIWSPNLIYKGIVLLVKAALNAQLTLVYGGKQEFGESYYNSINSIHGVLLMELSNNARMLQDSSTNNTKK